MKMHNIQQRSDEWYKIKAGRFSSSNIHILDSAQSTKKYQTYINQIIDERLSGVMNKAYSASLQWGTDNEPLAIQRYQDITGNEVSAIGFVSGDDIDGQPCLYGVSTDGLVSFDKIIEVKCPYTKFVEIVREDVSKNKPYYHQMQMGLWVTGRQSAEYLLFNPRMPLGKDVVIQIVMRDEPVIERIKSNIIEAEKQVQSGLKEVEAKISLTQKLVAA